MAIADLLSERRVTISNDKSQTVTLDVTSVAKHSLQNDVTDSPVEDGSSKTDNVRAKPRRLTLTGMLSNAPIGFIPKVLEDNISRDGFEQLESFYQDADRLTIITPLATYDDMVIETIDVDQDNMNVVPLVITFKKIETASSKVVGVPVKSRDAKKKKIGKKPAPPAKNESVLHKMGSWLGGS